MALADIVKKLIRSSALSLALYASGCGGGGGGESRGCRTDFDCRGDRICHREGYCYDPGSNGRDGGHNNDVNVPPYHDAGRDIPPNPELSGKIVFANDVDPDGIDTGYEIYTMNADGSNVQRLTNNNVIDFFPSWSPDGRKIAFTSDRNGNMEIYVMNADGNNQHPITNLLGGLKDPRRPRWSPDGTELIVSINYDPVTPGSEFGRDIYLVNADGSGRIANLTNTLGHDSPEEFDPDWSSDGTKIVYQLYDADGSNIYVMHADGSNVNRLTRGGSYPAWSPDGLRIAFMPDRVGRDQIYIMNANGSNVRELITTDLVEAFPAWSPDSGKMLYSTPAIRVIDVGNPERSWHFNLGGRMMDWTP